MSTPILPPELGTKVTTRTINWRQQVLQMWGDQWTVPDVVYRMSDGSKKESTDQYQTGIYKRT